MLVESIKNKKKTYEQPTFSWENFGLEHLLSTSGQDVTEMWNDSWNEMF